MTIMLYRKQYVSIILVRFFNICAQIYTKNGVGFTSPPLINVNLSVKIDRMLLQHHLKAVAGPITVCQMSGRR